ncbi:GH25 family lysozyme [Xylocopilactobacillus apis]|uniref:GH25 family lysozyme n=1 Tax=Xylocopilactobacillus apis TaxID=2932183 RepID=UPI002953CA6A|nr:GH25 family lysozyme [Xylocopilactobacillus apis]
MLIAVLGINTVNTQAASQFVDVSEWQPDTQGFIDQLVDYGITGVVVKLTGGNARPSNYTNPKAGNQIRAAWNRGLKVSVYHYAKYNGAAGAKAEAQFFAAQAQKYGLSKDTVMVADVEHASLKNPYADTVTFQQELARLGYHNQVVYSMASWFWYNKLPRNYPTWVAHYNVTTPGLSNITAWQYTNQFKGLHVDASYDYGGLFTNQIRSNEAVTTVKYRPSYGIVVWNGYDLNTRKQTGKYLKHGTSWKVVLQAKYKGEYWYAVGNNQWIQAKYTSNSKGYSNVRTVYPNSNPNGAPIATINYISGYGITLWNGYDVYTRKPTGRYLLDGSDWKIIAQVKVNGEYWYQLGKNQWIQAKYTTNPNGFTKLNPGA